MDLDFEMPLVEIEKKIAELKKLGEKADVPFGTEISELERERRGRIKKIYANLTPWQTVQIARHSDRPSIRNYIAGICDEFIEFHGDRLFGDDHSIIGGFASIGKQRFLLIGHLKGKTIEENIKANFGMAKPDGYRKALRLMKLAEKYRIPVVCFIDTPGAYPGLDAEARGQAEAIAKNLTEMSTLSVPIVVVVTGEGGSGGALGIGVGDVVLMLSYAVYSVISPEGCASILWRDGNQAPEAAKALKLTAPSLLSLGIIDGIIPEPEGGAHRFPKETMQAVRDKVLQHLAVLQKYSVRKLTEKRFQKIARIGRNK